MLPGVDDGPRTLDESIELARLAVADGTSVVVCTPHVHLVDVATLPDRVRVLEAAMRAHGIPLNVATGGEITAGTPLTAEELEILAHGPGGRRWVLLEAPLEPQQFSDFHPHADELEQRGYGLLIGHPERCDQLVAAGGGLGRRLRGGARLQINASSLTGAHGPAARRATFDLVARGLVAAIASDAHGRQRPPLLEAAASALAERGLDGLVLIDEAPSALLRRGISAPPRPVAHPRDRGSGRSPRWPAPAAARAR